MSHEVETMFYRKRTEADVPWHGLGLAVPELLSAVDAIQTSPELASEVDTWPLFAADPADGQTVPVPATWATVRLHDKKILGTVGKGFEPFQTIDLARFCDDVIRDGDVTQDDRIFETGGSLRGGACVWLLARYADPVKIAGDDVNRFIFIQDWRDGGGSLLIARTDVRVVCMNTLQLANSKMQQVFNIRHTTNADDRVKLAREALGMVEAEGAEFRKAAEDLAMRPFTVDDFADLAGMLFPIPPDSTKITKANREEKREELTAVFLKSPNLENIRQTRWGAFNAVAEWVDHAQTVTSESRTVKERRMMSLMAPTGPGAKIKSKTFDYLTTVA